MKKIDKIKLWIFITIRLIITVSAVVAIFENNWTYLGMSILILLVMLLPSIIEKQFKLDIPGEFEITLILYIFGALFLGSQQQFYDHFWWWDKMLHGFSGLILGNVGFLIVHYLSSSTKINITLSPIFVAIFSFCFAVTMGVIWEIYEYSMDTFFGFYMQRSSLDDTMTDLILDTIGAFIFAVLGYFHQKGKINILAKYLIRFNSPK